MAQLNGAEEHTAMEYTKYDRNNYLDYWHLIPACPIQKQSATNAAPLAQGTSLGPQECDEVERTERQSARTRSTAKTLA